VYMGSVVSASLAFLTQGTQCFKKFLRVTARSAKRVLAIVIMSVCLPVCLSRCPSITTRYRSKARRDKYAGVLPYSSVKSLVFVAKFRAAE